MHKSFPTFGKTSDVLSMNVTHLLILISSVEEIDDFAFQIPNIIVGLLPWMDLMKSMDKKVLIR